MRNGVWFLTALLLGQAAVVCKPSRAQVTATPHGYDFHVNYTRGQQIRFVMTTSTTRDRERAGSIRSSMTFTYHVLDVRQGVATIETTVSRLTLEGKPAVAAQTLRMQIDGRGHASGEQAVLNDMGGISPAVPPHALRIGESYDSTEASPNSAVGDTRTSSRYTFRGFRTVRGVKCAVLAYSGAGKKMQFTTSMTGTLLLSTTNGILVEESAILTRALSAGGRVMTLTQRLTITRI